jgi:hypothetical protein
MTRYATYNDWCDKEAEKEQLEKKSPVQIRFIPAAKIYLKTSTTLVTVSAYRAIYNMKTVPAAEEYVIRKLNLTRNQFSIINWDVLGNYCNMLAISQKIKVMKYVYDWQNIGMQKYLIGSRDKAEYLCPYQCGQMETPMHYLTCRKSIDKMSIMCLEAINRWMIGARTNNSARMQIMEIFYSQLPVKQPGLLIKYKEADGLRIAKEEQESLGWMLTMKGLLSKQWGRIQETEYEKIRKREKLDIWYTGTWWTKHLIKNIIFWSLNEWQKRNECLHNEIDRRALDKR